MHTREAGETDAAYYTRVLTTVIEPARTGEWLSIREAAYRAGMSDSNWRSMLSGRPPNRENLLAMALAVEQIDKVVELIGASEAEVAGAHRRLEHVESRAERELMRLKYVTPEERNMLAGSLRRLRRQKSLLRARRTDTTEEKGATHG